MEAAPSPPAGPLARRCVDVLAGHVERTFGTIGAFDLSASSITHSQNPRLEQSVREMVTSAPAYAHIPARRKLFFFLQR